MRTGRRWASRAAEREGGGRRRARARRPEGAAMLNVGDQAPDFSLLSDSGSTISLKDFRGRTLVLYFFPKADTPG